MTPAEHRAELLANLADRARRNGPDGVTLGRDTEDRVRAALAEPTTRKEYEDAMTIKQTWGVT